MPTDVKYNVVYDEEEVRLQNFINYMENHYELAVEFGKV
jgi:predicted PolB exonuclease-like 3'-5' exonuclease